MKLKKLAGLCVAGVMMMTTMTGCLGNLYTNVLKIEGEKISSGLYLLLQLNAYNEASQKNEEDTETPLLKQKIEDQKAADWIVDRTEQLAREYVAVQKLAAENNVVISEEDAKSNDEFFDAYWDMMDQQLGYTSKGIGLETVRQYYNNLSLKEELFTELYKDGGAKDPGREALAQAYSEGNGRVQYISIPLTDAQGVALEDNTALLAAVDAMLASLQNGDKTLAEAVEQDMPAIDALRGVVAVEEETAEETTEDEADAADTEEEEDDGLEKLVISYTPAEDGTGYSEEFLTELKGQAVGEFGKYESADSIMIYEKIDVFVDDKDYEETRETVLSAVERENYTNFITETAKGYKLSRTLGAESYYSVKKLDEKIALEQAAQAAQAGYGY